MGMVIIIVVVAFVVAAVGVLNNGTADKEYKRRQPHWDEYLGE